MNCRGQKYLKNLTSDNKMWQALFYRQKKSRDGLTVAGGHGLGDNAVSA